MKRIIFTLLMVVSYMLTSHAANIFTISDVQGRPGEEVTVSVSLDNSDAISAVDMTIPLDRQLTYVDGSCVLNSLRANGHQITAGANDSELRVVIYDLNTNVLKGNSGELFSFKLRLKKEPQTYTLTATCVLGNATGGNIPSSVEPGSVTIRSPKLTVITTKVDYGHIPIRSTYTQNVTIQNSGNERLEVSGVALSANEFSTDETLFSIDAGDTKDITINYAPVSRGAISETVTFNSNAINGKQKATLVADPFSVNELHVGSAMGASDEEVTISLTMNNMEPIVGMSCDFTLPEQLVYVDGSFTASSRAGNLLATSQANGNKLTLVLYSLNSTVIEGNDGEIATFKVRLNGTSGWYELYPEKVVLSNSTAENMTSDVSSGSVEIKSPSLHAESTLSMGDTPANETATAKYQINNYGEIALKIERVVFLAEGYSIAEQLPISIDPWQSTEITVHYKSTVKGHHSTLMNIYTNDPQNQMKQVEVSGNVYEPNSLELSGEFTEDGYDLSVSLKNYSEVVAMQMDIHWLNGMNIPSDGIKSSNRLDGLSSTVTKIGNGSYRVIIFSLNNTPIKGNDGEIFTLSYVNNGAETIDNSVISIDNLVFSTNKSENVSSESLFSYTIPARLAQSITLDKSEIRLKVAESETLNVTISPSYILNKNVVWRSSDESVATVIDGVVTAHKVGTADITAITTDGSNLSATCRVTVESTLAESITLDRTEATLKVNELTTLTVTVYPDNATIKSVVWSSSDNNVATVENGVVTAHQVGSAIITATTTDGSNLSANCLVTVESTLAESITLDRTEVTLRATETTTLTASVLPETTTVKDVIWSSSDENVATVENGVVTAHQVGYAIITATTTDGSNLSANCGVNVESTLAESIALDRAEVILRDTETTTLIATVRPDNATNKSVEWSSSDNNVATVENGVVTAHQVGSATITASTTDGSGLSVCCVVTVYPTYAEDIVLDRTFVILKANEMTTLIATVYPDNATNKSVEWSSSDNNVATVENGVVTAHQVGSATIIASTTDGSGLSVCCVVTVYPTYAEDIVLDRTFVILKANEMTTLTATVLPETTTVKDVRWESSDESVATVENGVVTAHQVGSATIIASTTDGSGLSVCCVVTVYPTLAESIILDRTEATLKVNETTTLTATVLPETTTVKDVIWSSSDENVATVENGVVTAHQVGSAIITVTTTDGSNIFASCNVTVVATWAESIELDRTEVTLRATETTTLTATVLPETTTVKDVVWSSSDENVATVENGVVTAHQVGFAIITATTTDGSDIFASCYVTVVATWAESIELDRTEVTLRATETTTLTATVLPETTTVKDVIWSSSDENVATVENGVVTAHQVGSATITATTTDGSNLSANCRVTVESTLAESITLDRTEATLKVNETTTLTATVLPETTTVKDVIWSSSDENVATVENGVVTAHQVGSVTITASTTDGSNLSATCRVTVVETLAESITLDRTEATLKVNETTTLTATVLPETTTVKDVIWSSSDENVATVENGVVTAHQVGSATIKATTTDGSDIFASCNVTVVATWAESIELDRTEVTLRATETTTLTATVLPETTTVKDVIWSSSDENVATVENGVVTAHQVGSATITATTTDGSNLSANCRVTVESTLAESITLDRTEATLKVNETTTLTATVLPETTTVKDVVWSSSDENVATVENGVVTAHQVGSATITASTTDGSNIFASCNVTVVATWAESIELDRTEVTLRATETTTLTATVLPETTTVKDVIWSSSDENVATVENGVVTAHQVGSATITASTTDGSGLSATCRVTVESTLAESITLDRTEATLKVNETTTLTATVLPETTTVKDVVWSSSDENVATVENGVVTAHQVGFATIKATTTDGSDIFASCYVTVESTLAESITLDRTEVTLKANEITTLTATILPETTTNKDVVWSSNDESVATVIDGVVTAHKVGMADITATTTDGSNLSATCRVTVEATLAESITLDRTEATLKVNETTTLTATVLPETTTVKDVVWSSSDENVATVENGVVTAHQVGSAIITVTTTDGSNLSANCGVTVEPTLAESIELNLYKIEAIVGEIVVLKATVYPDNTTEKGVVWSVSNDLVVSIEPIDNTSVRVCILQEGVATVTAKTVDGSDLSATCTIDIYSDINSVCVDSEAVKYYDLNGFNVKNPTNGVYIKVIGSKVKKVAL